MPICPLEVDFYDCCPAGRDRHNVYTELCVCAYDVTSIWPLIGPKWESYIVEEVTEMDELNEGEIFAGAGKQDK